MADGFYTSYGGKLLGLGYNSASHWFLALEPNTAGILTATFHGGINDVAMIYFYKGPNSGDKVRWDYLSKGDRGEGKISTLDCTGTTKGLQISVSKLQVSASYKIEGNARLKLAAEMGS